MDENCWEEGREESREEGGKEGSWYSWQKGPEDWITGKKEE